jgi:hypothetical protein
VRRRRAAAGCVAASRASHVATLAHVQGCRAASHGGAAVSSVAVGKAKRYAGRQSAAHFATVVLVAPVVLGAPEPVTSAEPAKHPTDPNGTLSIAPPTRPYSEMPSVVHGDVESWKELSDTRSPQ